MRKQPGPPPTSVDRKQLDGIITQEREYKLITPLFGGGSTPREADWVTIIRATEIRGQLRFWWRACRGGQEEFEGDPTKMKQEEDKIWGAAYKKDGPVIPQEKTIQITVEVPEGKEGKKEPPTPAITPPYAAFPLQPSEADRRAGIPPKDVLKDVSFKLSISFPAEQKADVQAALWAWETFGGVGGRTRRGFGALHLLAVNGKKNIDTPSSNIEEAISWMEERLGKFVVGGKYPEDVPHLSHTLQFRIIGPYQDELRAWKELINKLKNCRQNRPVPSGRSFWPEAEAIRRITKRRDWKYKERSSDPRKFPRAAFGLPIVFHFKDKSDPEDTTLQGKEEGRDRLASPLILRPLICSDGRAIGLALLLEGTSLPPQGLMLVSKQGHKYDESIDTILTPNEASMIPILKRETDVLKAFMDYIGGNTR